MCGGNLHELNVRDFQIGPSLTSVLLYVRLSTLQDGIDDNVDIVDFGTPFEYESHYGRQDLSR